MFLFGGAIEYFLLLGLIRFFLSLNYFLLILLRLEFIILSIFILLGYYVTFIILGREFIFLYLTMMICEGVFGLTILIYLTRFEGGDLFKLNI